MIDIHPLSKAEAERVFPPEERIIAAKRQEPRLRAIKQRAYRANKKAVEALASWFSKTGCAEDLMDYERAAEKHQLVVYEQAGVEAGIQTTLRGQQ